MNSDNIFLISLGSVGFVLVTFILYKKDPINTAQKIGTNITKAVTNAVSTRGVTESMRGGATKRHKKHRRKSHKKR